MDLNIFPFSVITLNKLTTKVIYSRLSSELKILQALYEDV